MSSNPEQQTGSEHSTSTENIQQGHGFGTAPVFLASVSTILGAILFLRFGYAVANVGLWGSLMIIMLGALSDDPDSLGGIRNCNEPARGRWWCVLHCQSFLR